MKTSGLKAANADRIKPTLPRITTWRQALAWMRKHPDYKYDNPALVRQALLKFYVFWITDGLQDSKAWELREDYADLLLNGCKPASPKDFDRDCKERVGDDKEETNPDYWFDLRGELEDYFR
jgi:hypothetical protein